MHMDTLAAMQIVETEIKKFNFYNEIQESDKMMLRCAIARGINNIKRIDTEILIESLKTAIENNEDKVKVILRDAGFGLFNYGCSECNEFLTEDPSEYKFKFCPGCGNELDWCILEQ